MTQTILAISAIALIAIVMVMGTLAPAMAVSEDKVEICHNGHTISVSVSGAQNHMDKHEEDTMGACNS